MDDDVYILQTRWSESALLTMRELLHLMSPIAQYPHWKGSEQQTLAMLIGAAARSTESVLLLTSYGQVWDAELPLRSVIEASVKLAYIFEDHTTFASRINEYSDVLFGSALLKDDRKIREFLNLIPNSCDPQWRPLHARLLSDEEKVDIDGVCDKQARKAIEGRWGFTRMISSIDSSNINNLKGMAHSYSMASHVQHADYLGVSIAFERSVRSPEREKLAHITHLARLISDTFSMFTLRLIAGYKFVGSDLNELQVIDKKMAPLYAEFKLYYDNWLVVEYSELRS